MGWIDESNAESMDGWLDQNDLSIDMLKRCRPIGRTRVKNQYILVLLFFLFRNCQCPCQRVSYWSFLVR